MALVSFLWTSGPLLLHDPRGPRPPFDHTYAVHPRVNELVVFPSWLVHEVSKQARKYCIILAIQSSILLALSSRQEFVYITCMSLNMCHVGSRWVK